jgi:hypothetical protein
LRKNINRRQHENNYEGMKFGHYLKWFFTDATKIAQKAIAAALFFRQKAKNNRIYSNFQKVMK